MSLKDRKNYKTLEKDEEINLNMNEIRIRTEIIAGPKLWIYLMSTGFLGAESMFQRKNGERRLPLIVKIYDLNERTESRGFKNNEVRDQEDDVWITNKLPPLQIAEAES